MRGQAQDQLGRPGVGKVLEKGHCQACVRAAGAGKGHLRAAKKGCARERKCWFVWVHRHRGIPKNRQEIAVHRPIRRTLRPKGGSDYAVC